MHYASLVVVLSRRVDTRVETSPEGGGWRSQVSERSTCSLEEVEPPSPPVETTLLVLSSSEGTSSSWLMSLSIPLTTLCVCRTEDTTILPSPSAPRRRHLTSVVAVHAFVRTTPFSLSLPSRRAPQPSHLFYSPTPPISLRTSRYRGSMPALTCGWKSIGFGPSRRWG